MDHRTFEKRFRHVDAELVAFDFSVLPARATLVLRFYAWWEHPLVREAVAKGQRWGVSESEGCTREVTFRTIDPRECRLTTASTDVPDVVFHREHPALWKYEREGTITCNGPLDHSALVAALIARALPFVTAATLEEYLPRPSHLPPFTLGRLPRTLYLAVRDELERADVPFFSPHEPEFVATPVMLALDVDLYIVASEFEIDVPEFEHRPEWFDASIAP